MRLVPTYLSYLRLKYTLSDLAKVKGRILDAGCGGGGFAKAISMYRPDLAVYGVDISRKAVSHAKGSNKGVAFKVGDVYALPFADNFFDAVIVEDVFEHLQKPYEALDELSRVVKHGGILSAFIPLEGSVFSLHYWFSKLGWKSKRELAGHIQGFKEKDVNLKIKEKGFKLEKKRYGAHLLGQIVDVGFFTVVDLVGRRLETGIEQHLENKKVLTFFKNTITRLTNFESQILYFVPGAGIHIKAVKK